MRTQVLWLVGVIAIIGVAAFIVGPQEKVVDCESNLHQVRDAIRAYWKDHNRSYPNDLSLLVPAYLPAIPTCPSTDSDTYTSGYETQGGSQRPSYHFTLFCSGSNHPGLPQDHPRLGERIGRR